MSMNSCSSYNCETCGEDDAWKRLVDRGGGDGDDANDDDTDVSNDDGDVVVDDGDENKAVMTALTSSSRVVFCRRSLTTALIASLTRLPMLVVSTVLLVKSTSSLFDLRRLFRFVGEVALT